MRTLSFEPDSTSYERIYAILVTGDPVRDRGQAKLHGDVLDKLEKIGQVKPAVDLEGNPREFKRDELRFYVTVTGGDVVLEEAEYQFVKDRCTAAFPGIHVSLTRSLDRAITWLEGLPKQEPAPKSDPMPAA